MDSDPNKDRAAADAAEKMAALSTRERQILHYLMQGETNKAIAVKLNLSVRTIEGHRQRLMRRLGARTSTEAIYIAMLARQARL